MKSITPRVSNSPSFAMAVKFNNSGKKFFKEVFKDNPKAGEQYIQRQRSNLASDIFVENSKISVSMNGQKWNIVNSIINKKNNGKYYEEILLMRNRNLFRQLGVKTLIRESDRLSSETYGNKGILLALAEDIANYQSHKVGNKKPSVLEKIKALFKNE